MGKSFFISALCICLFALLSGCDTVCQDPHSPNFNQVGGCINVAGNITGTYSGTLRDSAGSATSYAVMLKLTQIDNSDVSVQLVSPLTAPFTPFKATVVSSATGYYLSIISDSTISRAAMAYGSPADGVYLSSGKQLSVYAQTHSGTFEAFTGIKQ